MPTSNDMRKVLDIQDKHIIFEENCVTFGERRKKKAKFIHCTLMTPLKSVISVELRIQTLLFIKMVLKRRVLPSP